MASGIKVLSQLVQIKKVSAPKKPTVPINTPPTKQINKEVPTVLLAPSKSFAPLRLATTTLTPPDMPRKKSISKVSIELAALTAPTASSLTITPSIMVSVILNKRSIILVKIIGIANKINFLIMEPLVKSISLLLNRKIFIFNFINLKLDNILGF